MIVDTIKKFLKKIARQEQCSRKFALSCSVGVYVAFCPFFGLHTLLVFALSWLFRLNVAVTMGVSMLINNPCTMVPVYGGGYLFGDWIVNYFGLKESLFNPGFVHYLNGSFITFFGGTGFSFWAWIIGGNLIGMVSAFMVYPLMKRIFKRLVAQKKMRDQKRTNG